MHHVCVRVQEQERGQSVAEFSVGNLASDWTHATTVASASYNQDRAMSEYTVSDATASRLCGIDEHLQEGASHRGDGGDTLSATGSDSMMETAEAETFDRKVLMKEGYETDMDGQGGTAFSTHKTTTTSTNVIRR